MPHPDSEYNLAKDDELFNSVWDHGVYNFLRYEGGFCHTYDPPHKSGSGTSNGLYLMLGYANFLKDYGHTNSSFLMEKDSAYLMNGFEIYLHDKVSSLFLAHDKSQITFIGSVLVEI